MHNKPKLIKDKKTVRLYPKTASACRKVLLDAADVSVGRGFSDVVVVARNKENVYVFANHGRRTVQMGMLEYAKLNIFEE